ncbi:MAG TPA: hypothetical protein VNN62_14080 [Methylomirabilota bacterium]|nr:hypothetical protein [Methylomirabilota bacterium]
MVMAPGPAVSALPSQPPSPDGVTAVALAHYRQAFAALQRGDWSTFGAETDSLRKTLEDAEAARSPS